MKKILILSCLGGYGHVAATNTLKQLLGAEYEIETIYPIKELRIFGMPTGEEFYNYTLARNWTRFINWYAKVLAFPIFAQREQKAIGQIERHIQEKKPDIVISVLPFVNYPASEAARKSGVPFLLVTTDNDLYNWVFGLEKSRHENFRVTIGADLPTSKGLLLKHKVDQKAIETTGFPLRPNFFHCKAKEQLRQQYKIPLDKKVVLIVMGGVGGRCAYSYAKTIIESTPDVHLIVCAGRNKKLFAKLKKLGGDLTVMPFTEKMDELFAMADLIITKPGPGTINEVLSVKVPLLVDRTKTPLFWEEVNIDWVTNLKVGSVVKSFRELPALVNKFLYDEGICAEVAQRYAQIPENHFADRIETLIQEMCGEEVLQTSSL
ncbi:MAG: hypothetical protein JSS30_05420 [Verrucomicrobia bacterium]|nr:hypothetical protein [Verrucomicrobiota bacterium]